MTAKMIPYDTRRRIVDAYSRHGDAGAVADMFGVSKREVYRLAQQMRETGEIQVHTERRGRKSKLSQEQLDQVRDRIEEKRDITMHELITELDLPISISRLSRIVRKLGFRLKKKVIHASEQERPRRSDEAREL